MIEKLDYHYSMGVRQSVMDNEELTALELASRTANKMNEVVEIANTITQSAIESRAVVDEMIAQQDNFINENNEVRNQIVLDNQTYLDNLEASNTVFQENVNVSKTTFENDMTNSLNTFKTNVENSKVAYESTMNNSLSEFETQLNESKTAFETNMTNEVNSIVTNSNNTINADVNTKINDLINDGTISNLINDEIIGKAETDIQNNEMSIMESTGYGVISGLTVLPQSNPNMSVLISSGIAHLFDGKRFVLDANTTINIDVADALYPRKDVIFISNIGVLSYGKGVASASPVAPSPLNGLILAEINVTQGLTLINSSSITDKRLIKENIADLLDTYENNSNNSVNGIISRFSDYGINVKNPDNGLASAKGDGVTDDTIALQNIINYASTHGKKVFFPSGVYLISAPLVLPYDVNSWGLEISGVKSETKYQNLPSSYSSQIKATAVMTSLITNRGANPSTDVAYYNVVKNLVLDGNDLAERGYISGWQDKLIDSTVLHCTSFGVSLGDLSNNTLIQNVSMIKNVNGFESVASDTTIFFLDNCTIRENDNDGLYISSCVGGVIRNCVIESNGGRGVVLMGTGDVLKRVNMIKLLNCYWENNTGYAIEINRSGSTSPKDIEIVNPWINSMTGKAINIQYASGLYITRPCFYGVPTTVGYIVNENGVRVYIFSDENVLASANISITGASASKIIKELFKTIGTSVGRVFTNVLKANVLLPDAVASGLTVSLTPEQVTGAIITNKGQISSSVVTLPSPTENYKFRAICTVSSGNSWRLATQGDAVIYLDGGATPKAWIENLTPTIGDCIDFMAFKPDVGSACWIATPVVGAWTTY